MTNRVGNAENLVLKFREGLKKNGSIVFPFGFDSEARKNPYTSIHAAFVALLRNREIKSAGPFEKNDKLEKWVPNVP